MIGILKETELYTHVSENILDSMNIMPFLFRKKDFSSENALEAELPVKNNMRLTSDQKSDIRMAEDATPKNEESTKSECTHIGCVLNVKNFG